MATPGPDWDTRHQDGREEPRFLHHCIIQSPVEPLTTYELCITGPDQSQGQMGLTDAVMKAWSHFSGHEITANMDRDHLCYVAILVHPDGSDAWEACARCNELELRRTGIDPEQMQYLFTEGPEGITLYHDGKEVK